ncbi:MAG: metalloregulator ArsR/SmtB family transcription factor [Oscillospiraceae bacterium]|nr:metalloregulator ArsR/SmtB family transcription factor [Oscillospiraceae bacterium]
MLSDRVFSAISDPVRRDILLLLRGGPLSAGEIAGRFDITAAAISYHLRLLREAGAVREERRKNFIFYHIETETMRELAEFFTSFTYLNRKED